MKICETYTSQSDHIVKHATYAKEIHKEILN